MMQVILELDGVVIDIGPVHWSAYTAAAQEVGAARIGRPEFWRLVRTQAPVGQWLGHAGPRAAGAFQARFEQLLEADACWQDSGVHPALAPPAGAAVLRRIAPAIHLLGVSLGANRGVRQRVLEAADLSASFMQMAAVPTAVAQRRARLQALCGEHRRVLVAAATTGMTRAAADAGLFVAGIASGNATPRLLRQCGAATVLPDLAALADEIDAGATELITLGLPPPLPSDGR